MTRTFLLTLVLCGIAPMAGATPGIPTLRTHQEVAQRVNQDVARQAQRVVQRQLETRQQHAALEAQAEATVPPARPRLP